jgi:hypothetical protein
MCIKFTLGYRFSKPLMESFPSSVNNECLMRVRNGIVVGKAYATGVKIGYATVIYTI